MQYCIINNDIALIIQYRALLQMPDQDYKTNFLKFLFFSHIKSPGTPSSGRSTPTSAMPTLGLVNPNFSTSANNFSNNTGGAERSASASPLLFNTNSTNTASNLPMFNVNRSSSSILRQVLQEEDGDNTV